MRSWCTISKIWSEGRKGHKKMRAIQFAKIDFIKTKQQILWILLVIPVVVLFMLRQGSE